MLLQVHLFSFTQKLLQHSTISAITANPALSLAKHYHTLAPLPKGAGLRQGSLVSNTTIIRDTRNVQITQNLSAVKTEGSPASDLSAFAITSANNSSVTVPKNSVLYQYIFNLILTAIPKMLYRTVTAPSTQGSQV